MTSQREVAVPDIGEFEDVDVIELLVAPGDRVAAEQSLIELDKSVGDPVDLLVNGELFARGEVVTVSENFGVRITELVNPVH